MKARAASFAGFTFLLLADILSYHATTAFVAVPGFDESMYGGIVIAAHVIVFAVVALRGKRSNREPLLPRPTALTSAFIICFGFALILVGASTGMFAAFVMGAALVGCAQALLNLLWLSALPSFTYRTSYLFLLGGHALATMLCALVLLCPQSWYAPITLAAFLASCACATHLRVERPIERTFANQVANIVPLVGKGVLTVGLFALLSGFVSSLSAPSGVDATQMQYLVLGVSAGVLVIMSLPALAYRQPFKLESSYRVALPLSALGLLVLPGLIETIPPAIAGTLATTGYMMCGIVLYCTIAEVSKTARTPAMPLFAASDIVSLLCLMTGSEAGSLSRVYLPGTDAGFALIGLGTLYLVMLGASWLFGRERIPRRVEQHGEMETPARISKLAACATPQTNEPAQTERPTQGRDLSQLDSIAAAYGLKDQETIIFKQLLEGRTIARIAQDLYLSPSAVKYHAQKIYRACDVHTRAELAALMRQPRSTHSASRLATPDTRSLANIHQDTCQKLTDKYNLTDREQQTLERLACGDSVADIAQALAVSENTVKTYTKRVYRKLDVHSKQDIIDLCRDQT